MKEHSKSNVSKGGVDLSSCHYCGKGLDDYSRTIDHLWPKSRGGKLSNKNKVPSCLKCNQLKGDMNVVEFERALRSHIYMENSSHKQMIGYLKKVRNNVLNIISESKRDL